MKLQFDSQQAYQLAAVQAVINIFEGQPLNKGDFEVSFAMEGASIAFTEKGVGNNLILSESQIIENIQTIQSQAGLKVSEGLERSYYLGDDETKKSNSIPLNFTVEMETGTGKTYTYLRTIYELHKVYGFKKYVIVVPSVAIREGVVKNLQITHEHFQALYGNPPVNFMMYDGGKLSNLKSFATANAIQILVINIDSFTKDSNIINTIRETGVKPIEYIQSTCPLVILDEPQNMETDKRKAAIHNLNPLCTIRYSATHRNLYNLVYSLNPVQAYDLGLVKQIDVDGITAESNYNNAYIHFKSVQQGKKTLKVKLGIHTSENTGVKLKYLNFDLGTDLYLESGKEAYKDGFILNSINASQGTIQFSGGLTMSVGETNGGLMDEIIKYQIERTVKWHFEKEVKYYKRGSQLENSNGEKIKVLSLFFIDKVANYRDYDGEKPVNGKYAIWFEEIFEKYVKLYKPKYPDLFNPAPPDSYFVADKVHESDIPQLHRDYWDARKVHNGYFSQDKGKVKDTSGNTKADTDTYSLIMRDKERLLSFDEPLRFIFSHSALREGWDNPNIFQICTLNDSKSDIKKRQEIGRGLRLCVDETGQRISDKRINILTVIANESYQEFSEALQKEIQEETSVEFKGRVMNANEKAQITLTKELTSENCPLFFEIWEKINNKTRYRVDFSTDELINRSVSELENLNIVPPTKRPKLESKTGRLLYSEEGIKGELTETVMKSAVEEKYLIPDVYGYIQSKVNITRNTIFAILKQSGRYSELEINPQVFLDNIVGVIKRVLGNLLVEGVLYEQINGKHYEMTLFEFKDIEGYLSNLFKVSKPEKTLTNYIPYESTIESDFARDCEADENVKFFFKLPRGFKIPTPIGNYTPDWAIVFENDRHIYFVAETKGTINRLLLRDIEKMKIECGEKHFALFNTLGVEYRLVVTTKDLH